MGIEDGVEQDLKFPKDDISFICWSWYFIWWMLALHWFPHASQKLNGCQKFELSVAFSCSNRFTVVIKMLFIVHLCTLFCILYNRMEFNRGSYAHHVSILRVYIYWIQHFFMFNLWFSPSLEREKEVMLLMILLIQWFMW